MNNQAKMKLELDHKSPVPLHIQAEKLLRKLIEKPEYQKGKYLPNEVELARMLGISRSTLRLAINKLVYEGLLTRKKGIGTKVTFPSMSTRSTNWLSFSQEMKAKGVRVVNYELHISWEKPGEELMTFFNIEDGTRILKLERLRGDPKGPFVYFISFFNPRIGLTGNEDFSRPLYEILENDYSTVAKLSKEEISARAADPFLAEKLELDAGEPILKRKRMVFDPGGRPIEYNLGYYRADSMIYTLESERKI
jgi:GntR family transcriptional regulator